MRYYLKALSGVLILLQMPGCKPASRKAYLHAYNDEESPQAPGYPEDKKLPEQITPDGDSPKPLAIGELIARGHKIYLVEDDSAKMNLSGQDNQEALMAAGISTAVVLVTSAFLLKRKFRSSASDQITIKAGNIPEGFKQAGKNLDGIQDKRVLKYSDSQSPQQVKFGEFEDFLSGKQNPDSSYIIRKSTWEQLNLDKSPYATTKVNLEDEAEYLLVSHQPYSHMKFVEKSGLEALGVKNLDGANNIVGLKNYRVVKDMGDGLVIKVDDLTPRFSNIRYSESGYFPTSNLRADKNFNAKVAISREFKFPPSGLNGTLSAGGKIYTYKGKKVGGGAFGSVYVMEFTEGSNSFTMAIKKQSPDPKRLNAEIKTYNRELVTISGMSDIKSSVGFYGAKKLSDTYYLFMEPLDGDWAKLSKQKLNPSTELSMMIDAAEGLDALHKGGRLHYDLKPENVGFVGTQAKIIDYGLSKPANTGTRPWGTFVPKKDATLSSFDGYNPKKTDVFTMGLTFLSLKTKKKLWNELLIPSGAKGKAPIHVDSDELWKVLTGDGKHSDTYLLNDLTDAEINLLKRMTDSDWNKRPSMEQVVKELKLMQVVFLMPPFRRNFLYAAAA